MVYCFNWASWYVCRCVCCRLQYRERIAAISGPVTVTKITGGHHLHLDPETAVAVQNAVIPFLKKSGSSAASASSTPGCGGCSTKPSKGCESKAVQLRYVLLAVGIAGAVHGLIRKWN